MEATMHANPSADEPELSPGQRYGLLAAAVAAALLGLTTLDVDGTQVMQRRHVQDERSTECIVASAVFVGVVRTSAP
jgi:hypothetical protein